MGLDLRQELVQQVLWQEFRQKEFESKVSVTADEAKVYYDSYPQFFTSPPLVRTQHIIIKVSPDAPQVRVVEALTKINAVQEKLADGQTFEELARQYSEGPSAADGGSLGFIKPGQMDPVFEKTAFTLPPGKISSVIRTQFGFHIIKVTHRQPGLLTPFIISHERTKTHLWKLFSTGFRLQCSRREGKIKYSLHPFSSDGSKQESISSIVRPLSQIKFFPAKECQR